MKTTSNNDRDESPPTLPLKLKKSVQEKYRNYLSLIFSDLCAKDNGLNSQRVHQYTFLKVTTAMCLYFNP